MGFSYLFRHIVKSNWDQNMKKFFGFFYSMKNLSCQLQKSIYSIKFYTVPHVECNAYVT